MECPACGGTSHLIEHQLTQARIVCRVCGHTQPWMDEPEWRALVQSILDAMRGTANILRKMAEQAEDQAAA